MKKWLLLIDWYDLLFSTFGVIRLVFYFEYVFTTSRKCIFWKRYMTHFNSWVLCVSIFRHGSYGILPIIRSVPFEILTYPSLKTPHSSRVPYFALLHPARFGMAFGWFFFSEKILRFCRPKADSNSIFYLREKKDIQRILPGKIVPKELLGHLGESALGCLGKMCSRTFRIWSTAIH